MSARRALPRRTLLTTAIAAALTSLAFSAHAAPPEYVPGADSPRKLDQMVVEGHQVPRAKSPKYTQPLLDTPQTISQISTEVIEGQNLLNLRDVLSTLPGITFGAGEGGGGFGDSINLRGFSANNDITVDGMRDSAQYSRTDTFNLETVEVINGANSVNSGAGAVGGTINLVSKVARAGNASRVQAGAGSDSYGRLTVDSNHEFGESSAFRINAMAHRNDAPGRDVEEFDRWGFAPSVAFGLGSDTTVSLSYVHQEDENTPQYGVPHYRGAPLPGVDPGRYFGYRNVDTQEIDVDQFTAKIEHRFNDTFSVSNQSRQSDIDQYLVVDPPQGSFCLGNGTNPVTAGACNFTVTGFPPFTLQPGQYQPSGPRGTTRITHNTIAINQTDFVASFATGAIQHDLVSGFSISHESHDLSTGNVLRNPGGATPNPVLPVMDLFNPDTLWRGPINYIATSQQRGELDNRALYALDTLKFSEQWQLNLGARYERNEGSHRTDAIATNGTVTPGAEAINDDNLFSYRGGLVFKPSAATSYYLSYGNSKTPSKASVNGACVINAVPTLGTNNCNVDPETAVVTELGAKWDLYDGALALTAAIFRNDRLNYRVADPGNPNNPSGEQQLDGEARVEGLILGASGRIQDTWMVYANYAYLDSKVVQGVSDRQAGLGTDFTRGDRLLNTPEHSLGLWTTYDLNSKWQLGYGANYLGKVWLTQHSATNVSGSLVTTPGYLTHRAMVNYKVTSDLGLQLNVTNLFDKEYYTRPRNNGWATPGDTRSVVLTASYAF
ncbi:MAG: TonB-dependent receptor [Pseudomarimonas sp.]